jgi:hypothetical protein
VEQPERWRAFDVLGHLNAVTAVNHLAEAFALSVTARVVQPLRFAHPNGVATLTQDGLAKLVGGARVTCSVPLTRSHRRTPSGWAAGASRAPNEGCVRGMSTDNSCASTYHSIMAADASLGILPMLRRAQHGRRISR